MATHDGAQSGARLGGDSAEFTLIHDLLLRLPAAVAYVSGPRLAFEFANEEYQRIVSGRELIGRTLREAIPELGPERLQVIERVARTGQPSADLESEVRIRRPGHEPEQLFIDFAYRPVKDEAGNVSGVLICGKDVTTQVRDRRRLEVLAEHLSLHEARHRTLFEALPQGIIHCSADGRILGVNPAASQILGVARDSMTTWPIRGESPAVHEDGSPLRHEDFPMVIAMRTGRVVADVVTGIPHARTGEMQWLRLTALPYSRDQFGRPQGAYAIITDITEERRTGAMVRQSNRLLGRLRDSNVLGVFVAYEDGTIQDANDAYLDMIGYSREDMEAGRISWRTLTPPEWAARDQDAIEEMRFTGACGPYDKEFVHKDGHRVPVVIGAAAISGRPVRSVIFAVDLTAQQRREQERRALLKREQEALTALNTKLDELVRQRTSELIRAEDDRRRLEAELQRSERMETVGQLTSGIAHDFGNLLAVIVSHAEYAEDLGDQADPELRHVLAEIRSAANRAVHLSGDLLRYSQRTRATPEPIDLNALIAGTMDLLNVGMRGRAKVIFEPSPNLPAVLAERGRLEQVLINLALNARDAMPDGGTLTISTNEVSRAGRYVELAVKDTGHGMSPKVRERIFERFFTTKPAGQGTGLGLSTVYGIIKDANGTIDVDSREGQGTTFRIYLPAARRRQAAAGLTTGWRRAPIRAITALVVVTAMIAVTISQPLASPR